MRRLLSKKEVKAAVSGERRPPCVPALFTSWLNPFVFKGFDFIRCIWARFLHYDDISVCGWHDLRWHLFHMDKRYGSLARCVLVAIGGNPQYKKKYRTGRNALDSGIILKDMAKVDEVIARMPDPKKAFLFFPGPGIRYKLSWNFSILFENHWLLRGMENALTDYYLYPEETHRLYRAFTDYHKEVLRRTRKLLRADAVLMCDDLGTQKGPFFSPEIFREFFYPYYKELIDYAHSLGMHFWFHSCGDVTMFMDMFVEMGLDALHPVQKFAMDEEKIFEKYRDRITFFYGLDVQKCVPLGTPDDVEREIRRTVDLFSQAEGRLVFTFGNTITDHCTIENFERAMKVAHTYNPYGKTRGKETAENRIRK